MPAIEVNQTYRDDKEKAERIAFVKSLYPILLPIVMSSSTRQPCNYSPNGGGGGSGSPNYPIDYPTMTLVKCQDAYDKLKEWESKQ